MFESQGGDPEPDIVVERDGGNWTARGPRAKQADWGRTKAKLMETLAAGGRPSGLVVEVQGETGAYRTTIGQIRADYGKEYRGQRSVDMDPDNQGDPFFDFL